MQGNNGGCKWYIAWSEILPVPFLFPFLGFKFFKYSTPSQLMGSLKLFIFELKATKMN